MKRPLALFCFSALGAQLCCAFLPQTARFRLLSAAFFVAGLLAILCTRVRAAALCILLGGAVGLGLFLRTERQNDLLTKQYAGQWVYLTAVVEETRTSYASGTVNAQLHALLCDGKPADFRFRCEALPKTPIGQKITAAFRLTRPEEGDRLTEYADELVLAAECRGRVLDEGRSDDLRSRLYRVQQRLSLALRRGMDSEVGGVLAAMTLGDRKHLSAELRSAYRQAGLAHILVVSGLHVSILCSLVLIELPGASKQEKTRRRRQAEALLSLVMAVLVVGITGATPSVLRAATAVVISAVGVLLMEQADTLTSLGLAGLWMTALNGYAACDVGFELSFAAVGGTLAGAELAKRIRHAAQEWLADRKKNQKKKHPETKRNRSVKTAAKRILGWCFDTACISLGASAATFPILLLRGMSTSVYAMLSGVAVLWMVSAVLVLGLLCAGLGSVPAALPLYRLAAGLAELLVGLMNRWAVLAAGWPGARLRFDTRYAAIVCLILMALYAVGNLLKIRLRLLLPTVCALTVLAIGWGNLLNRDAIHITMLGSAQNPAVVLRQGEQAVVLFRGGRREAGRVRDELDLYGIEKPRLVMDLRSATASGTGLRAEETVVLNRQESYTTGELAAGLLAVEWLALPKGGLVRIRAGETLILLPTGQTKLSRPPRADWLLTTAKRQDNVRAENTLVHTGGRTDLRLRPGGVLAGREYP